MESVISHAGNQSGADASTSEVRVCFNRLVPCMSTGTQHHACLPDKSILDERSPPGAVALGRPRSPRSSQALLEGDVIRCPTDLFRIAGDVHGDDVIPFAIDVQRSDVDVRYPNVNDSVGVHHLSVVMMHADRLGVCI